VPTGKAVTLLAAMRRSQDNWTRHELETLYLGFDFEIRIGRRHDMAKHKKHRHLRGTLPNHKSFAKEYVRTAIRLINELQRLEKQEV